MGTGEVLALVMWRYGPGYVQTSVLRCHGQQQLNLFCRKPSPSMGSLDLNLPLECSSWCNSAVERCPPAGVILNW